MFFGVLMTHFYFKPLTLSLAALAALSLTSSLCFAQKNSTSYKNTQSTTHLKGKSMSLVKFTTNLGSFTLQLDAVKAPKTVANFVQYVQEGHYNGTVFHRVINNFMVQGGGFDTNMKQKPTRATVENEANNGLKNDKYTVAMARTSDPHSASAQFFINVKDNDFLNFSSPTSQGWGYAVFGKVVDGTDTVDKMKAVPTGNRAGHGDVPREDVLVEKAEVL
jgi:peptidyl-prolyl cis-trans isomerase B (cyclophilin B)